MPRTLSLQCRFVCLDVQISNGTLAAACATPSAMPARASAGDGWKSELMLALEGKSHRTSVMAPKQPLQVTDSVQAKPAAEEWKIAKLQQEACLFSLCLCLIALH